MDGAGDVFVADFGNNYGTPNATAVREIVAVGGSIPATNQTILTLGSGFDNPVSVAVDGAGNVFVVDSYNQTVNQIPLATPPSLAFATTVAGATSSDSPQTVLLQNVGNASLTFPAPSMGTNPSISTNFTLSGTSTCPQVASGGGAGTLAPGTCKEFISFTPTVGGSISGSLTATDNSLTATTTTQSVPLTGTGLAPTVTGIAPTFGPAAGGTSIVITGTNFVSGATVRFGTTPATSVTYSSANRITATSPAGTAGVVDVTVTQLSATSATSTADQFLYLTSQAITFTQPTTPATYGDAPVTLTATGGTSGNPVVFSLVSGPATVSGTNGSTLTYTGFGSVVVQADQAGSATYTAAAPVRRTIVVNPITAPITFSVPNHAYGDSPFTVSASSASNGGFSYSVVSGPATMFGNLVSLTGAGTVVLQASQAAAGNYNANTQNATVTVAKATTPITFTVPSHTFGDAPFTVSATSSSTGAYTYTVVSGPATISGNTVTLTGAGTVVLQAAQAAAGNYNANTQNATVTVAKATTPITYSVPSHTFGDAPFTVSATSSSTGAYTYTVTSGPATISGNTVTLTGAGTVVLQASQATDTSYNANTQTATVTVAPATAAITFTVPSHTFGDAPFNVSATSSSTGAYTYTVTSGPATISGNIVTLTGAGTVVLQASQAATTNYVAGTQQTTFTVAAPAVIATTTAVTSSANPSLSGASVTFTATVTAASGTTAAGTVNFAEGTTTLGTGTLNSNGVATFATSALTVASHNITATFVPTSNNSASSGTVTQVVNSATTPVVFTFTTGGATSFPVTVARGGNFIMPLTVNPSATFSGVVTFSCSGLPTGVTCTFTPPTLTFTGAGIGQTASLNVQTKPVTTARLEGLGGGLALAFALPGLLLAGLGAKRKRSGTHGRLMLMGAMLLMLCGAGAMTGCGAKSADTSSYAASGSYNFNVVATSGSAVQTVPVSLTIQ